MTYIIYMFREKATIIYLNGGIFMKVLMLNGSPNKQGCTFTALSEIAKELENQGIESEIINLGNGEIRDCIGCKACRKLDCKCVFDDDIVNVIINKAKECDGFIFGTPVYYAHASGRLLSVLDRVFYAGSAAFTHKPGAAVASARRAGTTASLDDINKYFGIAGMPTVPSTYWNNVHGNTAEQTANDLEGLQTMRNLARNILRRVNSRVSSRPSPKEIFRPTL